MEWYHVYLFTRLGAINFAIGVVFIISAIISIGSLVGVLFKSDDDKVVKCLWRFFKKSLFISVPSMLLFISIPSQKDAAAIYLLPKLANSEFAKEAQKLPTDAVKLMQKKLELWISDMDVKKDKGQ